MDKKDNLKAEHINVVMAVLAFLVVVIGVTLIGYLTFGTEDEDIQGEVEVREYRISSKLSGRIVKVLVDEGDYIHVGDTLAILESPETEAQKRAAQATENAARAQSQKAVNGTRYEQLQAAAEQVRQAEAAQTIAEKSYRRIQNLYDEGVVSEQKRDEVKAQYDAATAQLAAARSMHEMAVNGARLEDKEAAAAQAAAAQGSVDAVQSMLNEMVQISAVEGEVNKIYSHEGELVGVGSPIMNINLMDDMWGKFHIREDRLDGMQPGSTITAYSPSTKQEYSMKVYYMKGDDEYATWKATKADTGFDLKTFEVRARPEGDTKGLRAGMLLIIR